MSQQQVTETKRQLALLQKVLLPTGEWLFAREKNQEYNNNVTRGTDPGFIHFKIHPTFVIAHLKFKMLLRNQP